MPPVSHSASFAVTLLGATAAFLFANSRLPSCIKRLVELFPGLTEQTYQRLDAVMLISLGSTVGCLFCSHTSYVACLVSGLTWTTSVRMLLGSDGDRGGQHPVKVEVPALFQFAS
jgi:hypothetical protein